MGIAWDKFWHMNPRIIKLIAKGYQEEQKIRDREMWSWLGNYGISALVFAIDHCFSKKAKSEYIDKPVSDRAEKEAFKEMTEEERIQAERNKQYMVLKIMQTNFELSKM